MALDKPSDKEEEYFKKLDSQKRKSLRSELDIKREEERKKKAKTTHWMKCPKCGSDLKEVKVQDVSVDECTGCKGIWLDHGELELLAKCEGKESAGLLSRLFGK